MAKKTTLMAPNNSPLAFLLQVLYGAAMGLCGLHGILSIDSASLGQYLLCVCWLVAAAVAALYGQIILHEGGHMVFGLLTGYRFVSFRIGSWMVQKENGKLRLHRYTLAGTGGQCLMAPPDIANGKIPYQLYNAGGALFNLFTVLPAAVLSMLCSSWMARTFWELFCVMGLGTALTNGIPLRVQGVANDGANARDLGKDPAALQAFWNQLSINARQAEGVPLREMPEAWFSLPTEGLDNLMVAAQAVLHANRLMDEGRFAETAQAIDALEAQDTALLPLHHGLLLCDRLTCALLTGEDAAPLLGRWNSSGMKAFRKQMRKILAVLRTEYFVALLAEQDPARAETIRAGFEACAKTYPYAAEVAGERALLQKADALCK